MLQAAQLMDARVPLVRHDEVSHSCAQLMGPAGHLIVVDNRGRLVGVLDRTSLAHAPPHTGAAQLATMPPTVRPHEPATVPLGALSDADAGSVVVLDESDRPLGLISVADVVQVARFVLPPPWQVRQLMGRLVGQVLPQRHAHQVWIDDEARRGADVVALAGAPVPVLDRTNVPLGMVTALDVVDALTSVLTAANTVLVDPIS